MRTTRIDHLEDKAEGNCCGLAYTTELAGSQGVSVHFWTGATADPEERVQKALKRIRQERDVVRATWSPGTPTSYWAHQDIE